MLSPLLEEQSQRRELCVVGDERAGAHSVVRMGSGWRRCPRSSLRFQTHWAITCQHSCPQAEELHHRSGSLSWSSSERAGSKALRCTDHSTTSRMVKAWCGRFVKNRSETPPARVILTSRLSETQDAQRDTSRQGMSLEAPSIVLCVREDKGMSMFFLREEVAGMSLQRHRRDLWHLVAHPVGC